VELRDQLARDAMTTLLPTWRGDWDTLATEAYSLADAMMRHRGELPPKKPQSAIQLTLVEPDAIKTSPAAPGLRERVLAVWPRLRAAAAQYGASWAVSPASAQIRHLSARLREGLTEDELVEIIHGYAHLRGTEIKNDFDPIKFLVVKTLYRPGNYPDYLAAGKARAKATPAQSLQSAREQWLKRASESSGEEF